MEAELQQMLGWLCDTRFTLSHTITQLIVWVHHLCMYIYIFCIVYMQLCTIWITPRDTEIKGLSEGATMHTVTQADLLLKLLELNQVHHTTGPRAVSASLSAPHYKSVCIITVGYRPTSMDDHPTIVLHWHYGRPYRYDISLPKLSTLIEGCHHFWVILTTAQREGLSSSYYV